MESILQGLRKLGWFGNWLAIIITISTANWAVIMSTFIALWAALSSTTVEWVQRPSVYVFAGVFLFALWTLIGLSVLKNRKNPALIRIAHDYAYGLILDGGLSLAVARFPNNHHTNANGDAVMITCNFRNVSQGPLKVKIEEYRVILNNRVNDDSTPQPELIFARLAAMGIRSSGVPRENHDARLTGNLVLKFIYGHPDGVFSRRHTMKLNLQVIIGATNPDDSIPVAMDNSGLDIKDEPI